MTTRTTLPDWRDGSHRAATVSVARPAGAALSVVPPTHDDPLVTRLSEVVGGPLGRRARVPSPTWWRPERVVLLMVAVSGLLMVLTKQHCRVYGWGQPDVYYHACYSDITALFGARGISSGAFPYLGHGAASQIEYPVITGLVMYFTGAITRLLGSGPDLTRLYFDVNVVLLVGCLAVTVWATARTVRHRPWDAAIVALSPVIILSGTINWDLYAVALTSLALLAWSRERTVLAGVLLGLGTAAKFYPLLLVGPLLVLCWRTGQLRALGRTVAAGVVAWLVVNAPFMVANFDGWKTFYALSRSRGAGFSSIWFSLQNEHVGVPAGALNLVAGAAFVLSCLAIAWVAVSAPVRPRLASLAFLVVAAFLLTNKVYSPQYACWLIPLAALARPRWRDLLMWQAVEVVHYFAVWLYLAGGIKADRGLPVQGYDIAVAAHIVATLVLMGVVVRDIYRPQRDPVRLDGSDDPGGGIFDGAADVHVLGRAREERSDGYDDALPARG